MPAIKKYLLPLLAVLLAGVSAAQRAGLRGGLGGYGGGYGGGSEGPIVRTEGGDLVNEDTVRTARETVGHSVDLPEWKNPAEFDRDVFTYARIIFKSPGRASMLGWVNDYPDADLNLSYRLHQLTAMKVNPDGRVLKLTDPNLGDYPLLLATQPGGMVLREDEVDALRQHLLSGGVLVVDDFWGTREWDNFAYQMGRVLPGRAWSELSMEHPLFHCVFDLKGPMRNLQVPTINFWNRDYDPADPQSQTTRPRNGMTGSETMHVRAWLDDKGRIMVLALHNTDNGDGWEREGEDPSYFQQFAEPRAYPLAINIIYYLMTH